MTTAGKFKIQGVGIDTSTIITRPWKEDSGEIYDYIHTSISGNNDFLISDYVKSQPGASLITTIDFISNPEGVLLGHLMELGRKEIDLLLISSDCLEKNLGIIGEVISGLKSSKLIGEFGISNPQSVDQIKEIENAYGDKIKFISLDICPLHFNYEVINYSKENNIEILGFNPFGGYISSGGVISSFTIPYLLAFSATYSSIVFLSGRDLFGSIDCRNYLRENVIGSETSSKFTLKKSVSRLYKSLKKVVDTSLILNDNITLSYNIPTVLYPLKDICITLGKSYNMIPQKDKESRTEVEKSVYDLLDITDFPSGISLENIYSIARYQVLGYIRIKFPKEEGWEMNLINFGDKTLGIGVVREVQGGKKKFWKKRKKEEESNCFLLAVPDKDTILFLENPDLKNSTQEE